MATSKWWPFSCQNEDRRKTAEEKEAIDKSIEELKAVRAVLLDRRAELVQQLETLKAFRAKCEANEQALRELVGSIEGLKRRGD